MPIGYFYDVITNGFGAMADYSAQVPPADRWAIAAYVRTLQYSAVRASRRRARRTSARSSTGRPGRGTRPRSTTDERPRHCRSPRPSAGSSGLAVVGGRRLPARLARPASRSTAASSSAPTSSASCSGSASRVGSLGPRDAEPPDGRAVGRSCPAASTRRRRARSRTWRSLFLPVAPRRLLALHRGRARRSWPRTSCCRRRPRYLNVPFFAAARARLLRGLGPARLRC